MKNLQPPAPSKGGTWIHTRQGMVRIEDLPEDQRGGIAAAVFERPSSEERRAAKNAADRQDALVSARVELELCMQMLLALEKLFHVGSEIESLELRQDTGLTTMGLHRMITAGWVNIRLSAGPSGADPREKPTEGILWCWLTDIGRAYFEANCNRALR